MLFTLFSFLFIFFACHREEDKVDINLEYSSNLDWLEEQGYVLLDETHEGYDDIMSLLAGNNSNGASSRENFCQWIGQAAFACNGGTCNVYTITGAMPYSACLVCEGGANDGDADCIP